MAHKNLGRKRRCASCGIKFYDLTKTPAICPACGTEFDPEVLLKSRRGRAAAKVDEAKTPSKEEEDVNDDDVVEKAENDEFENDDDEVLASESDLISISADDDEETGSSGVELIDVLDDDLDDSAGSDDE
tara:strand:+ start:103 stop:492 length:390 start_codon:yes stop_codon:yes gene_type:complete